MISDVNGFENFFDGFIRVYSDQNQLLMNRKKIICLFDHVINVIQNSGEI